MRGTAVVVCLFLLALTIPAAATAASGATNEVEERMLEAINKTRARHDLRPLRLAPALAGAAGRYARRLMATDSLSHPGTLHASGFSRLGEALAWHRGWGVGPAKTVRMWLDSPAHRAILLSSSYGFVGTGQSEGRYGSSRATIWVARFGSR